MSGKSEDESYLFLLRVWALEGATEKHEGLSGQSQPQWQGKLQPIFSNEAQYFEDWTTLLDLLREMLPRVEVARVPGGKNAKDHE